MAYFILPIIPCCRTECTGGGAEKPQLCSLSFSFLTFGGPRIVIYSYNTSQRDSLFLKFIFGKELYMFRTGPLSIIRSISTLYTRNRYLSFEFCWRLLAWSGWNSMEFHPDHVSVLRNAYIACLVLFSFHQRSFK